MSLNPIPKIKTFVSNSKHILAVSYKPDAAEFNRTARIVILGILMIGVLGFIISLIVGYITGVPI